MNRMLLFKKIKNLDQNRENKKNIKNEFDQLYKDPKERMLIIKKEFTDRYKGEKKKNFRIKIHI